MLPYDILRILVRLISPTDTVRVLSTCKELHSYMIDEGIWQELCAPYGVATRDIFPDATFFEIYSAILHKYGPLLGLWASDRPYFGSIIEFRLDPSARCISGEIWKFHQPSTRLDLVEGSLAIPSPPKFYRLLTITLPSTPTPRRADLHWHTARDAIPYFVRSLDDLGDVIPTLRVLSQTDESLWVSSSSGDISRLPDFPDPNECPWYDANRGLPRLKVEPAPTSCAQDPEIIQLPVISMYMARSEAVKPAAMTICSSLLDPIDVFLRHEPPLIGNTWTIPIDPSKPHPADVEPIFHRRFYPLRLPTTMGKSPTTADWQPSSLEGIWLGSYRDREYDTEVLYVHVDDLGKEVRAMKITGNMNIPRGAITWSFCMNDRLRWHELPLENHRAQLAFGSEFAKKAIYRGIGSTSETLYIEKDREQVDIFVGIVGPDEIRINWHGMDEDYTPRYIRYKGRDVNGSSERRP